MKTSVTGWRVSKPIVVTLAGVTILLSGCGSSASQAELAQARKEGALSQSQAQKNDPQPSTEPTTSAPAPLLEVGQSVDEGYVRLTLMTRQSPSGNPNYYVVIEALQDNVACPIPEELYTTSAGERVNARYQPKIGCEVLNGGEESTSTVIGTALNDYRFPDMTLVFAPGGYVAARWSIPN